MEITIKGSPKEIAELLTLLFTARERLSDEKRDKALQKFFTKLDVEAQSTLEPQD